MITEYEYYSEEQLKRKAPSYAQYLNQLDEKYASCSEGDEDYEERKSFDDDEDADADPNII